MKKILLMGTVALLCNSCFLLQTTTTGSSAVATTATTTPIVSNSTAQWQRYDIAGTGENLLLLKDDATDQWGYVFPEGNWAIMPTFDNAWNFRDGVAIVKLKTTASRYGAINTQGQWVILPNFHNYSEVSASVEAMKEGKRIDVVLFPIQDYQTELYGYMNYYGEWYITPSYSNCWNFDRQGYAVVRTVYGKYGAINKTANFVIQPVFNNYSDAITALERWEATNY